MFTTAPMKQHRVCTLCGRGECVSVCDDKVPMSECSSKTCQNHADRVPATSANDGGTPAYAFRNGVFVPRSLPTG